MNSAVKPIQPMAPVESKPIMTPTVKKFMVSTLRDICDRYLKLLEEEEQQRLTVPHAPSDRSEAKEKTNSNEEKY